jgi:hypothetical protein
MRKMVICGKIVFLGDNIPYKISDADVPSVQNTYAKCLRENSKLMFMDVEDKEQVRGKN